MSHSGKKLVSEKYFEKDPFLGPLSTSNINNNTVITCCLETEKQKQLQCSGGCICLVKLKIKLNIQITLRLSGVFQQNLEANFFNAPGEFKPLLRIQFSLSAHYLQFHLNPS